MRTQREKQKYCTSTGLDIATPPLFSITPALDIITTRPSDPAHSEYGGISKCMHQLLMGAILTIAAQKMYTLELRKFPFPPGWARLQSPLHHLGSYRLQEHARWSIIIPPLLHIWLKRSYVQPLFFDGIQCLIRSNERLDSTDSPIKFIVKGFAAVAKSNSLLMAESLSPLERSEFAMTIKAGRQHFQDLHEAAALAVLDNPRSRSVTPTRSQQPSRAPSTSPTLAPTMPAAKIKAIEYRNIGKRPNMHVGIHYPAVMAEYGLPSHCNVLIGEDKHREYKLDVYNTNFQNVERDLLESENLRQTVRLLLQDAFIIAEPVLTQLLKELRDECPLLFNKLLPKSERSQDDLDEDSYLLLKSDASHGLPAALGRLQARYIRQELSLPVRSSSIDSVFQKKLRDAYRIDYGMPGIMHFGSASIPWSKKLSFNDPCVPKISSIFPL